MATYAYIATASGAALGKTLDLATGKTGRLNGTRPANAPTGIIHRRLHDKHGALPDVTQLKEGDHLVLMYEMFGVGIAYPICQFKLLPPSHHDCEDLGLKKKPFDEFPLLGVLEDDTARSLEPDYSGTKDDGKHLVLCVQQTSLAPPSNAIGHVFLRQRPRGKNAGRPPTIVSWDKIDLIPEGADQVQRQLARLVPDAKAQEKALEETFREAWSWLDGRGRQLLLTAHRAEKVATKDGFERLALSAYSLCALAEYEMVRVLKRKADAVLRGHESWGPETQECQPLRLLTRRDESGQRDHYCTLPLAPEALDRDCGFPEQANGIRTLMECHDSSLPRGFALNYRKWNDSWGDSWHLVYRARNRLMHTYFLEERHLEELKKSLLGPQGMLHLIHSP